MIITQPFKTGSAPYIREIILQWAMRRLWIFGLLVALCILLAYTVDTAFLFVATILLFLIFPFVVTFVYFNYGLKQCATKWPRTKQILVDGEFLCIKYFEDRLDDRLLAAPAEDKIPLSKVESLKIGKNGDTIYYGSHIDDFIIVGLDAFPEVPSKSREEFHELIYATIQRNSLSLRS